MKTFKDIITTMSMSGFLEAFYEVRVGTGEQSLLQSTFFKKRVF